MHALSSITNKLKKRTGSSRNAKMMNHTKYILITPTDRAHKISESICTWKSFSE